MFPTTVWTRIHQAGRAEPEAMEEFAERYRPAVLAFLRLRGYRDHLADDLCQDVFLRVLRGGVLTKADRARGRFRSLLLTVTTRVVQDHTRKRTEAPAEIVEPAADGEAESFDAAWALHLTQRALDHLKDRRSPYYDVLTGHIAGEKQDRNRLWIARKKLAALVRNEIAMTCASPADFDAELAHLSRFLEGRENQ